MRLSHGDIIDNARSCQSFKYVAKRTYWDYMLCASVNVVTGVCLKKFNGRNYDKAGCGYGLNNELPMRKCSDRKPFSFEKESELVAI